MTELIPLLMPLGIIVLLILINGLFVAAEFAIVGAPRGLIERRAAKGHRIARLVNETLRDPHRQDRYIATAQLGITLASLGLGMYGEHVLAELFAGWLEPLSTGRVIAAHTLASFLSIALLTFFHIVIGEMVPKSLALQYPEPAVLRLTPVVYAAGKAMYPLVTALNGLGNLMLRLIGVDRQGAGQEHYLTTEELQLVIQESRDEGALRKGAGDFLLDLFNFAERSAAEVMVPRVQVTGIPLGATPADIRQFLRKSGHTRYPVFEGDLDHIVGMVHIKDLLQVLMHGVALELSLCRPTVFLPGTATLDRVMAAMRRDHTQLVVVMDEHGGTAGLLTIEDLFDEVVGPIAEDNRKRPELFKDSSGCLRVDGTVRLDELAEELGIGLELEDVQTVSGLVLALLEREPRVGDVVMYQGVRFEVTAVAGHGVAQCVVTREKAGEESAEEEEEET